jgi:Protein of unknown function (DUF998)
MDDRRIRQLLLACGVIGPPLFVIVFLIEGATRLGYSAWRHPVSLLSLSDQGWMQVANFLVMGLLILAFAVGLRRALRSGRGATWGPILLAVFALALIAAGIFAADPILDYPPGVPPGTQSLVGTIHRAASLAGFTSLALACFVLARRFAIEPGGRPWVTYSVISGSLVIIFFITSIATIILDINGSLPNAPTGLLQRIAIIAGWAWITLLALYWIRKVRSTA